jgi:hypothetical protein
MTNSGGLRQQPRGLSYEGKLFATSAEDAAHFGRINYRLDRTINLDNPFHIVEVTVPDTFTQYCTFQVLDFILAVYVAEGLLPFLNSQATLSEVPVIPLAR